MNTMTTTVTDWSGSLWHGLTAGLDRFVNGVPTVLGAILILVIGWIIAGALAALVTKFAVVAHVDTLAGSCPRQRLFEPGRDAHEGQRHSRRDRQMGRALGLP